MAEKSLHDLFVEELRDMYDAEKRLTRALPKMAKAAGTRELQAAFTNHLRETEQQITRLERVFDAIGEKARGKKCDGMMGIVEEANTAIEELDGPVLDAALIAGAQKAEHYEIASYGTLAYFAELMGHEEAKSLLGETLEEEKAADEKLSAIARSKVNRQALMGEATDSESESEDVPRGFSIPRTARSAALALGFANDKPAARSRKSSARGATKRTASSTGRSSKKR
jgi:ferritin-like metal-binding protein YciE